MVSRLHLVRFVQSTESWASSLLLDVRTNVRTKKLHSMELCLFVMVLIMKVDYLKLSQVPEHESCSFQTLI